MHLSYICKHCYHYTVKDLPDDPTFLASPSQTACGKCKKKADKIIPVSDEDIREAMGSALDKPGSKHLKRSK